MAAVFLYGGYRVMSGAITVGTFIAFMAYQMRLMSPIQGLMGLYANLATVRVSLRRVCDILDATPDVQEQPNALPMTEARGHVVFDDVTLSFDRGGPVLEHLSFTVQPGEVLAIVGPSGSGKSTVTDLLLRLLDPDSGLDSARWPRPSHAASGRSASFGGAGGPGAEHLPCVDRGEPSIREAGRVGRRSPASGACRGARGLHREAAG